MIISSQFTIKLLFLILFWFWSEVFPKGIITHMKMFPHPKFALSFHLSCNTSIMFHIISVFLFIELFKLIYRVFQKSRIIGNIFNFYYFFWGNAFGPIECPPCSYSLNVTWLFFLWRHLKFVVYTGMEPRTIEELQN